jgi:hypothetical protein
MIFLIFAFCWIFFGFKLALLIVVLGYGIGYGLPFLACVSMGDYTIRQFDDYLRDTRSK